ncbi:MAG TPA: zf-HC2 domain-containing protein [Gemmatimonadales bacterium]|nr:zf-HC2 domain-containing protein [Gemmatimonadales bacterium]
MRHIPEEELHAYLDQALSRLQCVEIESHLAGCESCRRERDAIAALRDRTTALLGTLAPPRRIPPSLEVLESRAAARSARRAERWRVAIWAASLLLAVGLGWGARALEEGATFSRGGTEAPSTGAPAAPRAPASEPLAVIPVERSAPAADETSASPLVAGRTPPASSPAPTAPAGPTEPTLAEPAGAMLSSGVLPPETFKAINGALFRTVSWDRARIERGESVPRIAGLPVVEVQFAASRGDDSRPLMVVAQQLESGQVIRTIEGPATDVTQLLASQARDTASPWPTMGESDGIAGGDGAMAVRRGDRILAITAPLPSDSLRAMIRRLNATER